MIPTRYRCKLANHLTYPIGAEAITVGLAGAPHVDTLELKFYGRPFEPASRFQHVLAGSLPYPVVLAEYHPKRKPGLMSAGFMIESGYYGERWTLTVYPVLRKCRHAANQLLLERGLPALSGWLQSSEAVARGITNQRHLLVFNPADGSLVATEKSEHESSRV